ncbi:MAG: cytidine deaminase [Bacteroidales bacterium]|jgi:cytidine deaminase|nr:cytidine deaminase [Bacteroidales bacterium]MBQ6301716.1 cytidine deaminase [Bacteroidales bacterium]MBR5397616.1 cytidine deaminase [Bacteroidales bacterium]MCR5133992.1 cytidine deaminase [Bacteroidales bacterium]
MKKVTLELGFIEYSSLEEMDPQDQEVVKAAIEAQKGSYAPYSNFNVGAAVRLEDGTIVKGANQENAAYPSGLCAERTAMFAAGATYPGVPMTTLAIVGGFGFTLSETPCTPCGGCRQVMAEYQTAGKRPLSVIMFGTEKTWKFEKVDDILPFIFDSFNEK